MAKVYLETSFFSACVWDRDSPQHIYWQRQSRQWWVHQRAKYELFVSAEVLRELSFEGFRNRDDALALSTQAALLEINEDVRGLAKVLVHEKVMPGPEDAGDAVHVAAATVHSMDFLLTWNQKHLANRNKIPHLREVCRRAGFVPPEMTTPESLWMPSQESES